MLARGCAALDDAKAKGLCAAWGVASWDPSSLPNLIEPTAPRPSVLMVRAGLLVGVRTLDAADALIKAWGVGGGAVWGMSPFGGSARAPVWARIDPRVFLRIGSQLSRVQAAFRTAYHLPQVGSVAVGTDKPAHLSELVGALADEVEERAIQEYRRLLRDRARDQPA
jgi:aryl-alcohol dehydrogenase-like predicted oxidoreductase